MNWGAAGSYETAPDIEGMEFDRWILIGDDPAVPTRVSNVRENIRAIASYNDIYFDVVFQNPDGTEIGRDEVIYGGAATAPPDPTRDGFTFQGWDTSFDYVTQDLIVTALYDPIPGPQEFILTVVIDGDGAVDDVSGPYPAGTVVDFSGLTNTPADGWAFNGWEDEGRNPVTSVTMDSDRTVYVVFEEEPVVIPPEDTPEAGPEPFQWGWLLFLLLLIPIFILLFYRNVIITYYDKDSDEDKTRKRRSLRKRGDDEEAFEVELKHLKDETFKADVTIKKPLTKKLAKKTSRMVNVMIDEMIVASGEVPEDPDERFEIRDIKVK